MKDFVDVACLAGMDLFAGMAEDDIRQLLHCTLARPVAYRKDDLIVEEGSTVHDFGVVLSGHARSMKWDSSGKIIIISLLSRGSEIGVMLAARHEQRSPVSVQALDDVVVLKIPYSRLMARCEKACDCHEQLLGNYIAAVAAKGLVLHERIDCLLRPSVRDKILTYLRRLARDQGSADIHVPFNRNTMAEYLNIERSALSRELSQMKQDGLIAYRLNNFTLL